MDNEYHRCEPCNVDSNILATQVPSSLTTVDSAFLNSYQSDFNIYGVDKTKIIEKLEEELDSSRRSTRSVRELYETEKNEKSVLQKKNISSEKKIKKITRERDILKIELKISKDINRNLLNRLDNS